MTENRVLAGTVHIGGQVYRAGTTPPPEVAEQITNPKAWQGGGEQTADATSTADAGAADEAAAEPEVKGPATDADADKAAESTTRTSRKRG